MRIAMVGTRGVPAQYGGFETAVEEVGSRLAAMGHEVTVYCRGADRSETYRGMRRVRLPCLRHRVMETLSHTALSVTHMLWHRPEVALVFNAANAPVLPAIRAASIPVAVHVDGLEWKRGKWGAVGRRYYLANERVAVRLADLLIADAVGIQDYYRLKYGADSFFVPYGAPIVGSCEKDRLEGLGLHYRGYHLVVARLEPENHVDVIVEGYRRSSATLPLVVVGSVPYSSPYERLVRELALSDPRVLLLGSVWDQAVLDALYAGARSYVHGHSVGGTNPSLLRALGAGADTIAWDVSFNEEVLDQCGLLFDSPAKLAEMLDVVEGDPESSDLRGAAAQRSVEGRYRWGDVAIRYEEVCQRLYENRRKIRSSGGQIDRRGSSAVD